MSREVDAKLYDFLKENETGLYTQEFQKNKTVFAYVHIDFSDLSDFVEIVGADYFVEGGMEVRLMQSSVCVDINDYIEGYGHSLSNYKSCFSESDWERYASEIEEMEREEEPSHA